MPKSKQTSAEEEKTISIEETRKLRLAIVHPAKGIIELVNTKDQGRVCTLKADDFKSMADALIYAELLKLAPELLDNYLSDSKTLTQVLTRLEKKVAQAKAKTKKPRKTRQLPRGSPMDHP